jgi:hypothetical protein
MKQVYLEITQSNKTACLIDFAEVFKFDLQSNILKESSWFKIVDEINNLSVGDDSEKPSVRAALRFTDVDFNSSKMNQASTKSDLTFTRLKNCFKEAASNVVYSNKWIKNTQTTKKHEKDEEYTLV